MSEFTRCRVAGDRALTVPADAATLATLLVYGGLSKVPPDACKRLRWATVPAGGFGLVPSVSLPHLLARGFVEVVDVADVAEIEPEAENENPGLVDFGAGTPVTLHGRRRVRQMKGADDGR